MGKFNTRNGLSSLANSDVLGQFSISGGGASIPFLVDGATNRLLTLSDTNSGSVFLIKDADGNSLLDIQHNGITVGGNFTLPLTDGSANQFLQTDGSGAVTWEDLPTTGIVTVEVHNNTGVTLSKGAPVYVTGTHASGKPTVALTDADGTDTYPAIGLVSADIANGADGSVVSGGALTNFDTSAYTAGDALYIDTTVGGLTSTRPTDSTAKVQKVAVVTRSHASNGSVIVMGANRTNDIPNDVSLLDLVDTPSTWGTSGQHLITNGSSAQWSTFVNQVDVSDLDDLDTSPTASSNLPGSVFTYTDGVPATPYSFDGPRAGFLAVRQVGASVTAGAPLTRTGSGYSNGVGEIGVQMTDNNSRCLGLAFTDENSNRFVAITQGLIPNLDTSSFSTGDVLYVSNTTGALTNSVPTSGVYVQRVGYVVSSNATTGIIYANVDPAFDEDTPNYITDVTAETIGDLSNVNVSGAASGNLLRYDGTNWVDTTLTIPSSATVSAGATEVLKFTTSNVGTIGELDLDELGDVDLTTTAPTTNDVLKYDGSNWVPGTASGSQTLEEVLTAGDTATSSDIKVAYLQAETPTNGSTIVSVSRDNTPSDWKAYSIWRDTSSPAADDLIGDISWSQDNDDGTFVEYAKISGIAHDVSDGDEEGKIAFSVLHQGNMTEVGSFGADGTFRLGNSSQTSTHSFNLSTNTYANSIAQSNTTADWTRERIIRTGTPSDGDSLGNIDYYHLNSILGLSQYAREEIKAVDVSSGSEDGSFTWKVQKAGTLTEGLKVESGAVTVSGAYTLPETDGTANQVLTTDGSGAVTWEDGGAVADIGDIGNVNLSSPSTNQVLVYNQITSTWSNGALPAPTLADVTASGSSTSTTLTLANILQTGTHLNVATSGNWFNQHRVKVLEVGASTASLSYTFPSSDGTADQVMTTNGSGDITFQSTKKHMTFWNQGMYQMSTSTDTLYRYSTGTSYPNYGLWNSTSSTVPSSLTRTPQRSKGGHIIPEDITGATVKVKVGFAIGANTALSSSAAEYLGDTVTFAVYRWPDGGSAVLLDDFTGTFNGGNTTGEEEAEVTITNVTLNEGDVLCLVSICLQQASTTRYMPINYTMQIEY